MPEASIIKNKYRVLRQVGQGGMGSVFEVVHEGLGTTYALKQLRLELENNPEIAGRFRHEAQMMARLQHPNIVRVFDIDSEPGFGTYLLMELIKGVDLGKMLRSHGRLKYIEVLRVGSAIASALDTAHRAGLVHRDIKPANILIEEETARAVVTDFGIAKQIENVDGGDESVTRTGSFIGTYRYCSPEQIRNEKGVRIDGRADIYSLGVVLYEMFSGNRYLDGMSEMQIAHHVGFQADWEPPLEYPEPPPPEFKQLVNRCLAHDREKRPTAAEVCKQLDQLLTLDHERSGCLDTKRVFEELGSDADVTAAVRALATAEALCADGDLTQAVTRYREAEAGYRQAIAEKETTARYRQAIRDLRPDVEAHAADLRRLQQELAELNIAAPAGPVPADVEAHLQAIGDSDDAAVLEASRATLQDLDEQVSRARREAADLLRRALHDALADFGERCAALDARAGEFATRDQGLRLEQVTRSAEAAIAEEDWPACRRAIADGLAHLEQTEAALREHARVSVGALVDRAHAILSDLRARAGASATVAGIDELEADVNRCVTEGRLHDAKARAEATLAAVTAARDQAVRDAHDQAALVRSKVEGLLASMPLDAARALAPDLLDAASAARNRATEAERQENYQAAAANYEEAARLYAETSARVVQRQAARLDALDEELTALLRRAADAPAVIVGEARARAEALLATPRPEDLSAALAAREAVQAQLTAALDDVAAYAVVEETRSAAEAQRERVLTLEPSRQQLQTAERLMHDAEAAVGKRQWDAAQQYYAQAREAFAQLERELQAERQARQERERAAAARAQLDAVRAGLDVDLARTFAAEQLDRARTAVERAEEAERGSNHAAAAELYEQATPLFEEIGKRVAEHTARQLDAVENDLKALLQQCAAAPTKIVEDAQLQAQALVHARHSAGGAVRLADMEHARAGLQAALEEAAVFAEATERQMAAETLQRRVGELGASRRQLRAVARSMKQATAATNKRDWAAARDCYQQAEAVLSALEQALRSAPASADARAGEDAPTRIVARTGEDAPTRVVAASAPLATAKPVAASRLPSMPLTVWIGTAATGMVAVLIVVWALKVGPFAHPPAEEAAIVEHPAAPAPVKQPAPERHVAPPPAAAPAPVEHAAQPAPVEHAALQPAPVEHAAQPAPEEHAAIQPPAPPEKPVALPRIASFAPPDAAVSVREGARQPFSVAVAGQSPDVKLPIEWKLNDKVVASNVDHWEYHPDYTAADGTAREVHVSVGSGTEKEQSHAWRVDVQDVNRPPVVHSNAPSKQEVPLGNTVDLRVNATDDDGDPLSYAWTVDGKKAGTNSPDLKVVASADHAVALTVSDGKDSVTSSWKISAVKPPNLVLDFTPKQLDELRFKSRQEFALVVPPKLRTAENIRYAWLVDDKKVSDARTFVFKEYDASMVTSRPVSIVATASDAHGQTFSHEWKVRVIPPPPDIAKSAPPAGSVETPGDRSLAFDVEASAPVGAQKLTYVYEVDGKRAARGADGRFTFQPSDDKAHEVVAYVEDNYQQASRRKIKWNVHGSNIVSKVQDWLREYERAWNAKDARKLGELRGLNATLVAQLEQSLKDKSGLRVKFSDIAIEKIDSGEAKASYHRSDEWTGARDGRTVSRGRRVEQTFRLEGTRLTEMEAASEGP